jgi:hypothetical protein
MEGRKFMSKPEVVCLCGSCKFWDEFQKQASRLTLEGKIVLSVGVGKTDNGQELTRLVKSKLDVLHLRKIDLADSIFVIDVNGYIGESTEREIEYAISHGKQVNYLSAKKITGPCFTPGTPITASMEGVQ